jgi:hypothetical protein
MNLNKNLSFFFFQKNSAQVLSSNISLRVASIVVYRHTCSMLTARSDSTRILLEGAIVAEKASGTRAQVHVWQWNATYACRAIQTRSVDAVVDGRVAQSTREADQALTRVGVEVREAFGVVFARRRSAQVNCRLTSNARVAVWTGARVSAKTGRDRGACGLVVARIGRAKVLEELTIGAKERLTAEANVLPVAEILACSTIATRLTVAWLDLGLTVDARVAGQTSAHVEVGEARADSAVRARNRLTPIEENAAVEAGVAGRTVALVASRRVLNTSGFILTGRRGSIAVCYERIAQSARVADGTEAVEANAVDDLQACRPAEAGTARALVYPRLAALTRETRQAATLEHQRVGSLRAEAIVEARIDQARIDCVLAVDACIACRTVAHVVARRAHTCAAVCARRARAHVYLILTLCVGVADGAVASEGTRTCVLTRAAIGARWRIAAVYWHGAVVAGELGRAYAVVGSVGGYAGGAILTRRGIAQANLDLTPEASVSSRAYALEQVDCRLNANAVVGARRRLTDEHLRLTIGACRARWTHACVGGLGWARHTRRSISTRAPGTGINAGQALRSLESGWTPTAVHVNVRLTACAAILTRVRSALVDVDLTQGACVARVAVAIESESSAHTGAVEAGRGGAVVDLRFTVDARVARVAAAHVLRCVD